MASSSWTKRSSGMQLLWLLAVMLQLCPLQVYCQLASFADTHIVLLASENATLPARRAAFGGDLARDGLILAVRFDPNNIHGCNRSVPANVPSAPWVALVERGDCSFVEKVRNLQSLGAKAVIVGDYEPGGLIIMYGSGDTSDIIIPSLFLVQQDFKSLCYQAQYKYSNNMIAWLVPSESPEWPIVDVILVTVVAPVLLLLVIYTLCRLFTCHGPDTPTSTTSQAILAALPTKTFFHSKVRENDPIVCVICLDDFQDEDELRLLPCNHMFHMICVDQWLVERRNCCPICRLEIKGDSNDSESESLGHDDNNGDNENNIEASTGSDDEPLGLALLNSAGSSSLSYRPIPLDFSVYTDEDDDSDERSPLIALRRTNSSISRINPTHTEQSQQLHQTIPPIAPSDATLRLGEYEIPTILELNTSTDISLLPSSTRRSSEILSSSV